MQDFYEFSDFECKNKVNAELINSPNPTCGKSERGKRYQVGFPYKDENQNNVAAILVRELIVG